MDATGACGDTRSEAPDGIGLLTCVAGFRGVAES